MTGFQLAILTSYVRSLRRRGVWTTETLGAVLGAGVLFDEENIAATLPGVDDFEAGRHWSALHVLAPQVERIIRKLASRLGVTVTTFARDSQETQMKSLS